jgi:phenylacetate-CoA ligase
MASLTPLTVYPLGDLIALARKHSPFYARLYADLPENPAFETLPIVDSAAFWTAHRRDRREVLTGSLNGAMVLNSGGTTGAPKFSYYTSEELDSIIALSTIAFNGSGLQDGDRVANLFASGNLYSSMMSATLSLKETNARVIQFPIGYFASVTDTARLLQLFDINVLVGFPTHLANLIDHIDKAKLEGIRIERILYAGEMFSDDQRAFLERRFPGLSIRSAGYGSVDAGIIGYADETCAPGEHRVYDGATVVEIFDEETGEPITEPHQPGRIIFTALTRRLMPVLRYPVGDRGQWLEAAGVPARRFELLGRAGETARVASYSVPADEVHELLEPFRERLGIGAFQILVTREDMRDRLTLRLVGDAQREALESGGAEIVEAFNFQKPTLAKMIGAGLIHPVRIEWIERRDLIVAERTGKLRLVVDRRAG